VTTYIKGGKCPHTDLTKSRYGQVMTFNSVRVVVISKRFFCIFTKPCRVFRLDGEMPVVNYSKCNRRIN